METETLIIGKRDYTVELRDINQADLSFYTENPRVYSVLNAMGGNPTQEEIEDYLCGMDHVKQLKLSIECNGGLIDPLVVRDGDMTVLEGNSRLAAYRLLCATDPVKWGKVRCKVLPHNIDESAIFTLLGQYHIIGKKDWDPYEQAHYLYRRHKQTKLPVKFMAQELGITEQKAEKWISVIEFMIKHDDLDKHHWSHYEEYLKNPGIKKYRDTNADLDDTIAVAIKNGTIHQASDIRKLGDIAKVGDKQTKKIMQQIAEGEIDIYEGHRAVRDAGKFDDVLTRLTAFKHLISTDSFEKNLRASGDSLQQSKYEIKKIIKRLSDIQTKLGN